MGVYFPTISKQGIILHYTLIPTLPLASHFPQDRAPVHMGHAHMISLAFVFLLALLFLLPNVFFSLALFLHSFSSILFQLFGTHFTKWQKQGLCGNAPWKCISNKNRTEEWLRLCMMLLCLPFHQQHQLYASPLMTFASISKHLQMVLMVQQLYLEYNKTSCILFSVF